MACLCVTDVDGTDGEKANPSYNDIYNVSHDSSAICFCITRENLKFFLHYLTKIYDEPKANEKKVSYFNCAWKYKKHWNFGKILQALLIFFRDCFVRPKVLTQVSSLTKLLSKGFLCKIHGKNLDLILKRYRSLSQCIKRHPPANHAAFLVTKLYSRDH